MKKVFYRSLGILLFISCLSCDDFNSSQQYPAKQRDTHGNSQEHSQGTTSATVDMDTTQIQQIEDRYSNERRKVWQQPHLVLSMFGDLGGKTIADIGAGPEGYFTLFLAGRTKAEKILAIDIDERALSFINKVKNGLDESLQSRIETRIAAEDSPNLKENEVDGVLISETLIYIDDPVAYLSNLRKSIKKGGKLLIIDFKMKKIPSIFPSVEERMPLYKMEYIVEKAGFKRLASDDMSLPFHYMVLCENL